ncbi:T9SS type A sorting domain-containing protein [Parabacteroides sp. OttesenSCG-928-O15]|nr:T9SS type A sorting domain-containing protein [Parabacteroides sp. OttesenSCG-928-O15]
MKTLYLKPFRSISKWLILSLFLALTIHSYAQFGPDYFIRYPHDATKTEGNTNLGHLKPWCSNAYHKEGFIEIYVPFYHDKGGSYDHWLEEGFINFRDQEIGVNHRLVEMKSTGDDNEDTSNTRFWLLKTTTANIAAFGNNGAVKIGKDDTQVYNDEVSITENGPRQITIGIVRWYYSPEQVGKNIIITVILRGRERSPGTYTYNEETELRTVIHTGDPISVPALPEMTITDGFSANNPGYTEIYGQLSDMPAWPAKIGIQGVDVSLQDVTSTRETLTVALSNDRHFWEVGLSVAPENHLFEWPYRPSISRSITIPAYPQALNFEAAYENGIVTLNWNIHRTYSLDDECITGDRFEIDKIDEGGNATAVGSVAFDPLQQYYTLEDDIKDQNLYGTYTYRIRRTHTKEAWGWNFYKSANVEFTSKHAAVRSATAKLTDEGNAIVVSWDTISGIWTTNSKLVLLKVSPSGNTKIELSQEAFNAGEYLDEMVLMCNKYYYDVYVEPGSSKYAQEAACRTGECIPSEIGSVMDMVTSKGYFPDKVTVEWKAEGNFDNFIIRRVRYGDPESSARQIENIPGSAATGIYSYVDKDGSAGVYYTYLVHGVTKCEKNIYSSKDTLRSVGFRSPTGSIYGQVTYKSGQAVPGVNILLTAGDLPLGTSMYLDGNAGSCLYVPEISNNIPLTAFTFQAWIRPDEVPGEQVLFDKGGKQVIGFDSDGNLFFQMDDNKILSHPFAIKTDRFTHLSFVYDGEYLRIFEEDKLLAVSEEINGAEPIYDEQSTAFYLGADNKQGRNFKGCMEEVRIWSIALDSARIKEDYTRLLQGDEKGLLAYYRFDETIRDAFYDISYWEDNYNANHGIIYQAAHSATIPTPEQLSLKGITNEQGKYIINGIPYTGNGTTYTITPRLGTHTFSMASETRKISAEEPNFTVDFKDESSFSVSGHVFYSNSNVPVRDVMFYIDGTPANDGKGNIIMSDTDGYFNIQVPAGEHEVKAVKANHLFEKGGRITNIDGTDVFYERDIHLQENIYDSTRVRMIGRVAGGPVQEAYPLGHSLSKNNLAHAISIDMKYVNDTKWLALGEADSTVINSHHRGRLAKKSKESNTVFHGRSNTLTIYPNNETGEFLIDLIPEQFIITEVIAGGHVNIIKNNINVDLTTAFVEEFTLREYPDSLNLLPDTVYYNYARQIILRKNPIIEIKELKNGRLQDFFGEKEVEGNTVGGGFYKVQTRIGNEYAFRIPVYLQGAVYQLQARVFEEYNYYNERGAIESSDRVPSQDGQLRFNNGLADGNEVDLVDIDSTGVALYRFVAGAPDLTTGKRRLNASVVIANTTINWNNTIEAFVLGGKQEGTSFVTQGPDVVDFVLRDPPGSNSYSYIDKGLSVVSSNTYKWGVSEEVKAGVTAKVGATAIAFAGIGAGVITVTETTLDNSIVAAESATVDGEIGITETTTYTTHIQTSSEPGFVGADGDVFVGKSTNISCGTTKNISVIPIEMYDRNIHGDTLAASNDKQMVIVRNEGISLGQSYRTSFFYPQVFIEEVMLPDLEKSKRSFFDAFASEAEAMNYARSMNVQVYYSPRPSDDPLYGQEGEYKFFSYGEDKGVDSVKLCNESIKVWKEILRLNEKEKVEALKAGKGISNYSFHSGAGVEMSKEFEFVDKSVQTFSVTLGGGVSSAVGFEFSGIGVEATLDVLINSTRGGSSENTETKTIKSGFVLAEEGTSDYLSVDVFELNNKERLKGIWEEGQVGNIDELLEGSENFMSGYIFAIKGGATSCPYEPQYVTKYYEPGTTIGQSTARIEVPKITMPVTTITDVPEARKAVFTLELTNESETDAEGWYVLKLKEESNPHGAKLFIDGSALGNGLAFRVKPGEVLKKTLEVGKGAVNDYEDLVLSWESQCDSNNKDEVTFSVHFVTSCSYVEITLPKENWVLNTTSPTLDGRLYLPVEIGGYDVNFEDFHHLEFQYKASGASDNAWTTTMRFFPDSASYEEDEFSPESKSIIPSGGNISYKFMIDGLVDQRYDIAAVSVCKKGNEFIPTVSAVHSGIKDTRRPTLFGSIQPADGVLDPNDDILLTFNEEIIEGYINTTNFEVRGVRNGTPINHDVSVEFDGVNDYLFTEATRNLANKELTIEMWIHRDELRNGTLFSHGDKNNSFEISLLSTGELEVRIGDNTYTSQYELKRIAGMWEHIAVTYTTTGLLRAYCNWETALEANVPEVYSGTGIMEIGRSLHHSGNYFKGRMHELRVWNRVFTGTRLQNNSLINFSASESGMIAYYPMDEGKGKLALDKIRGANAIMQADWRTPEGKSIVLNGNNYLKIKTGAAIITPEMDYTIEFWYKGEPGQQNAALVSNGRGDGEDYDDVITNPSDNLFFLGFENGVLTFKNKEESFTVNNKNLLDNNWHHLAVSVKRSAGKGQIYIDGVLATYFDAIDLGGIDHASMVLGARRYQTSNGEVIDMHFKGYIDEFRLWKLYKDEGLVNYNNNVMMDGSEIGLLAYYPFEKLVSSQIGYENVFTLEDRKTNSLPPDSLKSGELASNQSAPIKPLRNELKLDFLTVVNKDALVFYPNPATTRWEDYEQSILTFTLDDKAIHDLNDNTMGSAVSWTVFVNRSQLHWSEKQLTFTKDELEPLEFTAHIVNASGSVEHYTIENLPVWMKAKPSEGTINPKSEQPITFTIAQGLNVGTYDEVIYLRSENNVTTPLPVTIRVMGEKPDWSVDPADFKYNMALYGKMRFNNIFSSDKDDMLAAFIDGECVGVANSVYLDELDMWYAFISIYSNEVQHEAVEFRMWDASSGQIYLGVPETTITFRNDKIYGSPRTPVIIDGENMLYQNITLNRGWNWISFNVRSESMGNVNNLLTRKGWTSSDLVKQEEIGFDIFTQNEGWIGDISDNGGFTNTTMYNLKTEKTRTISLLGSPVDVTKTPITIRGNRWNYISYLPTVNMSVNEALADYDARENDIVKSQNSFAMYAGNIGWIGSLAYLESGKGYMLYREDSSDHSFRYPRNAGSLNQLRSATDEEYRYADNMTVVARIVGGAEAMPGDKLVAFIDGSNRSRSTVLDDDLFFLTIPGDESSPIYFALERNSRVIARTYSPLFDYGKDRSIGTIREPLALNFASDQQATLYPNPFEDQLNILLRVDEPSDVEIAIYNLTGQMVHAWPKQAFSPGEHHLVWLADNQVSGMFIVRITINNQPATYKVIKK